MATREEVIAAYAANPKASLAPTEDAIQFWMQGGLGNFNQIVDEARAQNPALAAQIDTQRATTRPVTPPVTPVTPVTRPVTPTVDNSALYRDLVTQAYGGIGRTGFGTGPKNIDQSGYDFWLNALQTGALTPETFGSSFNRAVGQYVTENPTNAITQNVQAYKPFQNIGLLSQSQMQPQSMGAQAMPNYQPQSLAQNFQNYMGIPIGAQYNPAVTAGGASPYSQIKAISPQMVNPYAGIVANTAMGGYNPMLYENIRAANAAAAARAGGSTDYLVDGGSGGVGGDSGDGGGGITGGGGGGAMAKGGYVHGGLMFGANPPGPDDGAVNLDIGEYVIKKSSVDKYGKGLLDMINEGKVPAKKMKSLLG
jgi:hypothetical protein